MKTALILLLLLSCCISAASEPDCETYPPFELMTTFKQEQRVYQVAFIQREETSGPWSIDLIMRWRKNTEQKWHEAAKIPEVLLEKAIRLAGPDGNDIEALVVSNPAASAQFISVIEITKNPPGLKVLLNREWDKWNSDYRYDTQDRLIGFKFNYYAWHVSPWALTGHVYTARNIGWDPATGSFKRGPVYVDDQREQEADLAEVLLAIGSEYIFELEESYDENTDTHTFIYRPQGLLWRKTPPELRSAERVKVVITWRNDSAVINSIEAINEEK